MQLSDVTQGVINKKGGLLKTCLQKSVTIESRVEAQDVSLTKCIWCLCNQMYTDYILDIARTHI